MNLGDLLDLCDLIDEGEVEIVRNKFGTLRKKYYFCNRILRKVL